jgi:hypothetical protein
VTADARVDEIARMLGGDAESATSREHARELIAMAQQDEPTSRAGARAVERNAQERAQRPKRRV